jgi:hypothetical protein
MEKQLPSLITIRITPKGGVEGRIQVSPAKFPLAWKAAHLNAPKGAKVEALVAELYI